MSVETHMEYENHLYVSYLPFTAWHMYFPYTLGGIHFLNTQQPLVKQEDEKSQLLKSGSDHFICPLLFRAESIHSAILSSGFFFAPADNQLLYMFFWLE